MPLAVKGPSRPTRGSEFAEAVRTLRGSQAWRVFAGRLQEDLRAAGDALIEAEDAEARGRAKYLRSLLRDVERAEC